MPRKIWLLLLVVCSGCVTAPPVSPCTLDPLRSQSYCTSVSTGKQTTKPISEMRGYSCYSPEDTQILTEWIKNHIK